MRNQLCAAFAAFTVLTAGAAAQLTPLVDYYQRFDRGITIGTNVTTLVPGTIRWNALLSQLQYYHTGGYWTSIGSGSGGGGGLVVRNVGEDGTNSWTPTGIDFDRDTGLNVETAPGGAVRVSLGSHWYYLVDGAGVSNKPSGQQDLRIVSTAGVSQVLWDTNTSPWTLYFPQSTGPKGDPGTSFGVYRGSWSNGASYEAGDWMLHGGSGYGALTNFTADNSTPTNATGYGTDFIRLWYSGTDGSPGVPGVGLRVRGNWELGAVYDANDLVRDENKLWYTPVGSSGRPSDNPNQWTVLLRDGADGMEGVVFSNAVWAGRFNADALYPSNTIVYANSNPYGGYYVHTEYDGAAYVGDPGDTRLADTGYFTKLWHYARDGERGLPGAHGADGVGNLWFDREGYQERKTYTNGTVVIHNGGTYIYTKIEAGTAPAPGAPGWETYWQQAAAPGVPGGDWAFSLGFDPLASYDSGDVVVTDDSGIEGWFYLCKSDGTTTHPTNSAPGTWELLTKPGFRTFPILDPAPEYLSTTAYTVSNLVRYMDKSDGDSWGTYVCIADTTGNAPPNTNYWAPIAVGKRGPRGPAGAVTTYYVHTNSVYYYETNITEEIVVTNVHYYNVDSLVLVPTNSWDLFFGAGGALTLWVDATPAGTTNILEMVAGTNDTNLVLRPDGANGVEWGEETAESDPLYSAWATNGPGATNAILADGTLVSIDGWGSGGITNIGDGLTGDGLANALEVERWADVEEMLENQTNVVSVAGGPSAYTVGRFPVWDGNTWVQSEYVPASSTGAVSSVNLMVGHIAVAGFGVTSVSTDTNTSTITIGTSTNEVRAIRDEAFRPYTTLGLSGGTALVSRASGRWLMIEADNGEVTLDVDAASYTDPLEAIQHQICWVRGTNETYAIVTNNIDNTLFVDLPASTTNHLFLERRPGWPRFQIWQDFR